LKDPKFNLEERLLAYATRTILLVERLPATRAGNHLAGQLLRSGTSILPNHGEAGAAESPADFIHKMKICLKELRETWRWLLLIQRLALFKDDSEVVALIKETDQLIRIFYASIRTAQRNDASGVRAGRRSRPVSP
jgi:four helix bundle protein